MEQRPEKKKKETRIGIGLRKEIENSETVNQNKK